MVTKFVEIEKARLAIGAIDATYGVQFLYEVHYGRIWEFDQNSDAIGQNCTVRTGNIKVFFKPIENTMAFPEDANRGRAYLMTIEKARDFYQFLIKRNPQYWFALDMAREAERL